RRPLSILPLTLPYYFSYSSRDHPHLHLSLHDALPICSRRPDHNVGDASALARTSHNFAAAQRARTGIPRSHSTSDGPPRTRHQRSEEHTSELQSRFDLVCRLLLEKKKTPTV